MRSLGRGLEIVELLSVHHTLSLAELHSYTSISKPSLLRALSALLDRKWIQRRLGDGKYQLASKSLGLATQTVSTHPLQEAAAPHLVDLEKQIGWPSDIAIVKGVGQVEILDTTRSAGHLQINTDVVGLSPSMVYSAIGRVYLAHCPEEERRNHLEHLLSHGAPDERYLIRSGKLGEYLTEAQKSGYAFREPGYWARYVDSGVDLMAIAVIIRNEEIEGCLTMTWISDFMSVEEAGERYGSILQEYATKIAGGISEIRMAA